VILENNHSTFESVLKDQGLAHSGKKAVTIKWKKRSPKKEQNLLDHPAEEGLVFSSFRQF
jgi:hypothetical protein